MTAYVSSCVENLVVALREGLDRFRVFATFPKLNNGNDETTGVNGCIAPDQHSLPWNAGRRTVESETGSDLYL